MVNYNPADMTYSADIDGHAYNFTLYDADKGFRTMCEVSQMLGAGIGSLQRARESSGTTEQPGMLLSAAQSICSGLGSDPERSLRLVKRLCCDGVTRDGVQMTPDQFALHFAGKMPSLLKVVTAALEVQFGNFFDLLKSSVQDAQAAMNSSPSTTKT